MKPKNNLIDTEIIIRNSNDFVDLCIKSFFDKLYVTKK